MYTDRRYGSTNNTRPNSKTKNLWQLFFEDEEQTMDEDIVSSPSSLVDNTNQLQKKKEKAYGVKGGKTKQSPTGDVSQGLLFGDSSDEEVELEGAVGGAAPPKPRRSRDRGSQDVTSEPRSRDEELGKYEIGKNVKVKKLNDVEWQSVDLDGRKVSGKRFQIRRESDLELALPSKFQPMKQRIARATCCQGRCSVQGFTKSYACVVLVGLALILLYALIITAIVKGM